MMLGTVRVQAAPNLEKGCSALIIICFGSEVEVWAYIHIFLLCINALSTCFVNPEAHGVKPNRVKEVAGERDQTSLNPSGLGSPGSGRGEKLHIRTLARGLLYADYMPRNKKYGENKLSSAQIFFFEVL